MDKSLYTLYTLYHLDAEILQRLKRHCDRGRKLLVLVSHGINTELEAPKAWQLLYIHMEKLD